MSTKICFKCNTEKDLSQFYKHPTMPDGYVNKCKECNKRDIKSNYENNIKDPKWIEKEQARHREKYKRLNYNDKQTIWNKDKPWTKSKVYKGLNKKFKLPKGYELHHWNYNDEYLEDVFILDIKIHRQAHRYLVLDIDKRIFKDLEGNYLDTKEKHKIYLLKCGILIS